MNFKGVEMRKLQVKIPGCFFSENKFKDVLLIDYESGKIKFADGDKKNTSTEVFIEYYSEIILRFKDPGLFDDIE